MFSGQFLPAYQSVASSIGFLAMQARYPRLTTLDDASTVDIPRLAAFYGCPETHIRIEDDETGRFVNFSNPQKMYYKIRGAQDMLEASGMEFDGVMRIRPDKGVAGSDMRFNWRRMLDQSHNERVFFADFPSRTHPSSGLVIGDQAGIATMELMHLYACAEQTTSEAAALNWRDFPVTARAHANLSHALWINGVRVDTMPMRWGQMFDPDPLSHKDVLALVEQDIADRDQDSHDERLLAAAKADLA